jgi:Rrf2 family protein
MRISTRGRYGLKIIVDLAEIYLADSGVHANVRSIAKRQGLSENYIEQLVAPLKKAGYVTSVRGAKGGYLLAKPPEGITVGEILRLLEGSLAPVDCLDERDGACGEADCAVCVTKNVWNKINDSLNDVVDKMTIMDMMKGHYGQNPQ